MPQVKSGSRLRAIAAALVLTLAACIGTPEPAPAPAPTVAAPASALIPGDWPLFAKTIPVPGRHAIVSSIHPIAGEVGVEVLRNGGSAVDAAVAVGFALAVVHPSAGNIGGGGFMIIRLADGAVQALDYRETAPGQASRDMYLDAEGTVSETALTGHLAAGVPGSVAGLAEAHRRYGKLSLDDVIAPAIRLARDGFILDEHRSRSLRSGARRLKQYDASRRQFLLPNGEAPPAGTKLVQPDLARTLQAIVDSGPRVFYEGYIADLIVREMKRGGGLISKQDLASYRPIWRDPVAIDYRGHTIFSMPPSSSGGVTMGETLNILEGMAPIPQFGDASQVHFLAEAMRRAFTDRNQYLGDPAFVEMPLERLLSKEYATELRSEIDPERATPTPRLRAGPTEGDQTTHYSVVDAEGNAVSVTTTINSGYGNAVTVAGAGFLLNNEMDDFAAAPGKPNQFGLVQGEANAITPGKRMLSSMAPSIVLDPAGELLMVLGTPGGPTIITTVTQVISNVIDHGMSLAGAIAAPRVHHQALPDTLFYERGGLLPEAVARLRAMGHAVKQRSGFSGQVAGIIRQGSGWIGVADPRAGGSAVGY